METPRPGQKPSASIFRSPVVWRPCTGSPESHFDDLFQVACVGLLRAIDWFDTGRGIPFSAFAVPTVLGELKHHLRRTTWSACVPRRAQHLAQQVDTATHTLTGNLRRSPRLEEIARYLEIKTEEVLLGLNAATARYTLSLEALPALWTERR